jgi:hypothetical protein
VAVVILSVPAATVMMMPPPGGTLTFGDAVMKPVAHPAAAQMASAYHIRPGDTLSAIAARLCGNPADYAGLAAGNGIADPDLIASGSVLWHITCTTRGPAARPRVITHAGRASAVQAVQTAAGVYSYAGLVSLWISAGGPSRAASQAARIAQCESGGVSWAHNPSGAAGLWQILGLPFPGNPYDPMTNARMAVAKFRAAGGSFAAWVCRLRSAARLPGRRFTR